MPKDYIQPIDKPLHCYIQDKNKVIHLDDHQ